MRTGKHHVSLQVETEFPNFAGHGQLCLKYPKITSLRNLCNTSRKKWGMKLIICADKHQSFLQFDTIKYDGSGQCSMQYPTKEVSVEVDFLCADEHQSILKVDTVFFDWFS